MPGLQFLAGPAGPTAEIHQGGIFYAPYSYVHGIYEVYEHITYGACNFLSCNVYQKHLHFGKLVLNYSLYISYKLVKRALHAIKLVPKICRRCR